MAFDGPLWGRRVQATGQTPVATATGFVVPFTLDNFQGTRNEIVNGGSNSALNGGGDIRVSTDDAGANQLPLDVDRFVVSSNTTLQDIAFWVRFPTYEAASRSVWIFYNRAGQTQPPVTDQFGRNSVWQDFIGSCHFSDPVTGSNDVTSATGSSPDSTSGTVTLIKDKIGGAYSSDQNAYISVLNPCTLNPSQDFTCSQLIRFNSLSGTDSIAFGWISSGIDGIYVGSDISSNGDWKIFSGGETPNDAGFAPSVGVWYKVDLTYDSANNLFALYINGTEAYSVNPTGSDWQTGVSTFAVHSRPLTTPDRLADASTSEFSTRQFLAPSSLLSLEGISQNDPSTFWTMGEPEDTGGSTGITVSVTESLNGYQDSSTIGIQANVNVSVTEALSNYDDSVSATVAPQVNVDITVTELLNSYTDSASVTVTEDGNISATITESLNNYQDASAVDIQRNIELTVTEALNSYSDSANARIAKEVSTQVTEVLSSYIDNASIRLPTQWVDKAPAKTDWTVKTKVTTIWSDK